MTKYLLTKVLFVILILSSCKTERTMAGKYRSIAVSRSTLILNNDFTFHFTSDNIKFLLTGENFFFTIGNWSKHKNILTLNSFKDISIQNIPNIEKTKAAKEKSTFAFLNENSDTIRFHTVYKNGEILMQKSHSTYSIFEDTIKLGDNLKFLFDFGYKPFALVIEESASQNYQVTLRREFRHDYFSDSKFKIRRVKLIDLLTNEKFKSKKFR